MKILTISEPECGGKPTGFATVLPNGDPVTMKGAIVRGLVEVWDEREGVAIMRISDEDLEHLRKFGFVWLSDYRFLVETTNLSLNPESFGNTPSGRLLAASKRAMENYRQTDGTLPYPYFVELGTAVAELDAEVRPAGA